MSDSPPTTDPPPEPWGWTFRQRAALAILLTVLLVFLIIGYLRRPWMLGHQPPTITGQPLSLPAQLDPNTASSEELVHIANLPQKTAENIINWRSTHAATTEGGIIFHSLSDLAPIPGINKKILDELRPLLQFPDETQPAK